MCIRDSVRVWGKDKVFPMVMERIWEDPTELSDFLGHPIPEMYRNVYYPERGTDREEFSEFPDQWINEKNPIDYDKMREEFDWLYKCYEKTFGEIPIDILEEYGRKDVDITKELYDSQQHNLREATHLQQTVNLMN